ncbi:uncharacterized protein LOC120278609 [Dioscorea cayenensis subsp. rotundata]|uniref:Uncharacterized protein LOC120278609 n=1 Tax=Dioscorea cayennensis subsp. rotundata TaxID=55577 RepID=A0AB40CMI2_DIOCR|nr:uncharacterized protein LOC120278609 [Dioscorea cayenensis subsp. rotundata]
MCSCSRNLCSTYSCNASVASTVYNHLSRNLCSTYSSNSWIGWHEIWRLPVIPRIKVHIWKLAHGKLSTYSYLYNLNIGRNNPCPLCGLEPETAVHLFWSCPKILLCWHDLFAKINLPSHFIDSLSTGAWLLTISDPWSKALIATILWLIWKQRCNLVFRNEPLNTSVILPRAWAICTDFNRLATRECALLSSNSGSIVIFTDASWSVDSSAAGLGFLILTNSNRVLAACSRGISSSSPLQAKIAAINFAFNTCTDNGWTPNMVFCDCPGVAQLLNHFNISFAWHVNSEFHPMRRNSALFPNASIHTISRDLNSFADTLANFGNQTLTRLFFYRGFDRPFWIEELCLLHNLSF